MMRKIVTLSLCGIILSALLVTSCKKPKLDEFFFDNPPVPVINTSVKDTFQTIANVRGVITNKGGSDIIQCGVCYGTAPNPTVNSKKIISDSLVSDFIVKLDSLSPQTDYYVRAFATNSDGTGYGASLKIKTKNKGVPVIYTDTVKNITQTNAWATGTIISDGGDKITFSGFCYSTTANPTVDGLKTSGSISASSFTDELKGLTANVKYYLKAYATNSFGTAYGKEISFTTQANPTKPVLDKQNILSTTDSSAVVESKILSDGGKPVTEAGVCYGTIAMPTIANNKISNGTVTGVYTCTIKQLSPGTDYYVRAYAINSIDISYSDPVKFTTGINVPVLSTKSVSSITYSSAISGGTVSSNGGSVIKSCGICYSTTPNPTVNYPTVAGSLSGNKFDCTLSGLYAKTKYYVRAYATNNAGTGYGNEFSFTTSDAPLLPSVTTSMVTSYSGISAIMGGEVAATGGADVTERGVCYATTPDPTTSNTKIIIGSGLGVFSQTIDGLAEGTKYYVRAYAMNITGVSYGAQVSFTTLAKPTVKTGMALNVSTESIVILGSSVSSDGGGAIIERGVCYSTTPNPMATSGTKQTSPGSTGDFTITISGLTSGTKYYVRAYATNSVGTTYGEEVSYTTIATQVTDIDGNVYPIAYIGDQTWMAANLKTTKFNDGTAIPLVPDRANWCKLYALAYCWYNNDEATYKATYGALYNWNTVNTNKLCPTGWHVPSDGEWTTLIDYLGGDSVAGTQLIEGDFKALMGGYRYADYYHDGFNYVGGTGVWWSSTMSDFHPWYRSMWFNEINVSRKDDRDGGAGYSVRCLKD